MRLFVMYVGTEHSTEGAIPKGRRDAVLGMLKGRLAEQFGGYSLDQCSGGYKLANGKVVEEGSVRVELLAEESKGDLIRDIARWIKGLLAQESVLLMSQPVDYSFI